MSDEQRKLEEAAIQSIGSLLARQRWDKATEAERKEVGRKLVASRRKKARRKARGKAK